MDSFHIPATVELVAGEVLFAPKETWELGVLGGTCAPVAKPEIEWKRMYSEMS